MNLRCSCIFSYLLLLSASVQAADPPVSIELKSRQGEGQPIRECFAHTGGGNIDVQQPAPDTVIITMTGVAVAGAVPCKCSVAAINFHLVQEFAIVFAKNDKKEEKNGGDKKDDKNGNDKKEDEIKKTQFVEIPSGPDCKKAKLTLEARVIGLLRSHKCTKGSASINCPAHALINGEHGVVAAVDLPGRSVCCGENLTVNDKQGPMCAVVPCGCYTLNEEFGIQAIHPCCLWPCKAASAEFAPDPALDPLWISAFEPFHGAIKKDFGFQVVIKVTLAD